MENRIKVTGIGEVRVKPDVMQIHFTISECDKKYDKALKTADSKVTKLKAILNRTGIRQKNIVTTNFNVNQKLKNTKNEQGEYVQEFVGYEVKYNLTVSFAFNAKLLGTVMTKIADSVSTPQITLSFALKNTEKVDDEAISKAVENARHNAQILANASGLTLGKIAKINFDEQNQILNDNVMFCARNASPMESFSSLHVNELVFSKTVEVEWEIA